MAPKGNLSNITCRPRDTRDMNKRSKIPLYIFEICQNWGHSQNFRSLGNFRIFFYEAWFLQRVVWTRQHGRDNRLFEQLYHPNMATHAWILKIKDHWKVLCKKLGIKKLILSILYINSKGGQICPPPPPERIKTKKKPERNRVNH